MCGRYTLRTPWHRIADYFGIPVADVPELFAARYNVAPTQQVLAGRQDAVGRHASYVKWGFVPSWSKDGKIAPIIAMSETVAEKPMFRPAMKKRRCLVAADGFYEWKKNGKAKQPIHFHIKSGEPFGFSGIWETWRHGDEAIETVAILTTEPNELTAAVHNRMPVILRFEYHAEWLNPDIQDTARLAPFPADDTEATPICTVIYNARNERPKCLEPV